MLSSLAWRHQAPSVLYSVPDEHGYRLDGIADMCIHIGPKRGRQVYFPNCMHEGSERAPSNVK